MNKALKRALALVLALVMVCSLLTGCGQQAASEVINEEAIAQVSEPLAEVRTLLDGADYEGAAAAYAEALKAGDLSLEERAEAYAFLIAYYFAAGDSSKAKAYLADAANDGVLVNAMLDFIFDTADRVEQSGMPAQPVYDAFMNEAIKQRDYQSAVKLADTIMDKYPKDNTAMVAAYIAYKESGNNEKAAEILAMAKEAGYTEESFNTATVNYIEDNGIEVTMDNYVAGSPDSEATAKPTRVSTTTSTYNAEGQKVQEVVKDSSGNTASENKYDDKGKLTQNKFYNYNLSALILNRKITDADLMSIDVTDFKDGVPYHMVRYLDTACTRKRMEAKLDSSGNILSAVLYEEDGSSSAMPEELVKQFGYTYDSKGNVVKYRNSATIDLVNGVYGIASYEYINPHGRIVGYKEYNAAGNPIYAMTASYDYSADPDGQVVGFSETMYTADGVCISYSETEYSNGVPTSQTVWTDETKSVPLAKYVPKEDGTGEIDTVYNSDGSIKQIESYTAVGYDSSYHQTVNFLDYVTTYTYYSAGTWENTTYYDCDYMVGMAFANPTRQVMKKYDLNGSLNVIQDVDLSGSVYKMTVTTPKADGSKVVSYFTDVTVNTYYTIVESPLYSYVPTDIAPQSGTKLREDHLNANGELTDYFIYSYDEYGNLIGITHYDAQGTIIE